MNTPRANTGFTVIELVLAMGLASLVAVSAMSLFGLLYTTDRRAGITFDEAADLAAAQTVIRRTMQGLIAGVPLPDGQTDGRQTATPDPQAEEDALQAGDDGTLRGLAGRTEGLADESADEDAEPMDPDYFELFEEEVAGARVQRLEIVLDMPPVRTNMSYDGLTVIDPELVVLEHLSESIRGAFELSPARDGWTLSWVQMDPPAGRVVLLRQLTSCTWRILPRRMKDENNKTVEASTRWQDTWSAYLRRDFPIAVELSFTTAKGANLQWVFETNVTVKQ